MHLAYLSEFRPYILALVSLSTLILGKFIDTFGEFVDPLFWLTQHINKIIDDRQARNVGLRLQIQNKLCNLKILNLDTT